MSDNNDFHIKLYSIYRCWPELDDTFDTIFSGSARQIPEELKILLIRNLKNEIKKGLSLSTFMCLLTDTSNNHILKKTRNTSNVNSWKAVSTNFADKYSKQVRAKNAILMVCKFNTSNIDFIGILRYNLTSQIQFDDSKTDIDKLKVVEQILDSDSSKSAIYPSATSVTPSVVDQNVVKIHDASDSEYFRNSIEVKELSPQKIIDIELKRLYQEALSIGQPLNFQEFSAQLQRLINLNQRNYKRTIKNHARIEIGDIKIIAKVSSLLSSIRIEKIDETSFRIIIDGPPATIKYDIEKYNIVP